MFSTLKDKLPLIITILVLIVAISALAWFGWARANEKKVLEAKKDELNVSWIKGPSDAKVLVEIFVDFQCSHCKDFTKDIEPKLVSEFSNQSVRFELKHFPIFPNSITLAEAAEAAGSQGKFWEYHDKMFENFGNLTSTKLIEIASEIGLDVEKFKSDTSNHKFRGDVNADKDKGNLYNIQGTPSIAVNGKIVNVKTDYFKDISNAINAGLGKESTTQVSSTTTKVGDL